MSLHIRFIWASIGLLAGIGIGNSTQSFFFIILFLTLSLVCGLFLLHLLKRGAEGVLILGVFLCVGVCISLITWHQIHEKEGLIKPYFEKKIQAMVKIKGIVKKSTTDTTYRITLTSLEGKTLSPLDGYLKLSAYKTLALGDTVQLKGFLKPIKDFSPLFSYRLYLLSQDIYYEITNTQDLIIKSTPLPWYVRVRDTSRTYLLDEIFSLFPHDEAVFLGGILIGSKTEISEEMESNFQKSGLTHLITVSGFNITVIVIFLGFLLQKLPLGVRILGVPLGIILYAILVGASAPVVRASIMGIIGYVILLSGRKGESLALTLATLSIMVIIQPLSLNYDVSLHLSFLALLGLVYYQSLWKRVCRFLPKFLAIRESFVLTLSAMTTTLPVMLFQFGQVSIFAPFANMLVGGVIPVAMALGTLSIIANSIYLPLGYVVGYVSYFPLLWVNWVAGFFGNLPNALITVNVGAYGPYLETLTLGMLVVIAYMLHQNEQKNQEQALLGKEDTQS